MLYDMFTEDKKGRTDTSYSIILLDSKNSLLYLKGNQQNEGQDEGRKQHPRISLKKIRIDWVILINYVTHYEYHIHT